MGMLAMAMLAMTILVHFGCYMGPLRHLRAPQDQICGTIASHLGHATLVRWQVNLHMAMAMAKKQG